MANSNKLQVFQTIFETGMVPVFYHPDAEVAKQVLKACYEGGVRAFEFTNRGDFAQLVFKELAIYVREQLPGMVLGAGSVLDPATAVLYLQLGADFIVGPCFNPEVARVCNRRLVPYIPGCGLCKVFPGEVLGPAFVKAVLAPMPWSRLMVTGGVKPEKANLEAWFKAGATCVGMGSQLFPKDAVAAGDWGRIKRICQDTLKAIEDVRAHV